ncbi:hypothetical protein [Paenibacillus sp. BJ-4]|uniref:hypothetical protein n=1 Tax=Paenibacillus sp. BJ-4 TaxID=2878097 RepID=UPI001CF0CE1E|nr:hypothetical protein [Paenibacillus sp. BJ-4]
MPSTFEDMKREIETGWDIVLWSKSYGMGEAAKLAACIYFGCAAAYLGQELKELADKVGEDLLSKALQNKGKIFGSGQFEVSAGDAYWSVYHKVWNPFKRRHEKITTERFVRLYVRMRRKARTVWEPSFAEMLETSREYYELPEYTSGMVYPLNPDGTINP